MNAPAATRLTILLSVICAGLFALTCCLSWNYGWLKIQVAFASDQTEIFDSMRAQATQRDPKGAAECLEYVVGYYPSGTKQERGSRLDCIVERDRAHAIRAIIECLRSKTGEDLGTSPEAWIKKFVTK